jgi:hypothetical protein
LLVSANPATRTLDAVFWAFETDPHAFRLAMEWRGGAFTYVMTNGILVGQQASDPVRLEHGHLLGKPTDRRNRMKVSVALTNEEKQKAADELTERRFEFYQRSVNYVERSCDESVQEQLRRLARLNENGDHRMSSAVLSHVLTMFEGRISNVESTDQFLNLLIPIIDMASDEKLLPGSPANVTPGQGWAYWLGIYRQCLDVLHEVFGLPGYIFQAKLRT